MPESLWNRISGLPLVVESHAVEHLSAPAPADRTTLLVRLRGGGAEGLGEDVGGTMLDEDGAFLAAAPDLPLAGEWTLASFVEHLRGLQLWPQPPEWEMGRRWRNWAFESAALDLALQQAGIGLPEALGREAAPLRFVHSLGLGDPPAFGAVGDRLERYPDVRFKLDAKATWSAELTAEVAGTGAVDVIDFKGRYGLPIEDEFALLAMYEAVLERFDGVILEDPHDRPDVAALIEPHAARVSSTPRSRASPTSRRPPSAPGPSTSSRRGSEACARCSTSMRTARRTACACTAAAWARSGSRAARSNCSRRSSTRTAPTTSRRRPTTCRSCPTGCPRAHSWRTGGCPGSAGARRR